MGELAPDEIAPFIANSLARAGISPDLLTFDAVTRLAEQSGGVPRTLTALMGAAVLFAHAERAPHVEARHVDQAAALRINNRPAVPAGASLLQHHRLTAVGAVAALAAVGVLASSSTHRRPLPPIVAATVLADGAVPVAELSRADAERRLAEAEVTYEATGKHDLAAYDAATARVQSARARVAAAGAA